MHKLTTLLLLSILLTSCGSNRSITEWYGLGPGDSYLEIKDSTIRFNGPDYWVRLYKITFITKDSIFSNRIDPETGRIKEATSFGRKNKQEVISGQVGSQFYDLVNVSNLKQKHNINKISYKRYHYGGWLEYQVAIDSTGLIKEVFEDKSINEEKIDLQKKKLIFDKISILDLDRFEQSEKNFFTVSHASCHCLEIYYDKNSYLSYCRQLHNGYINDILRDIRSMKSN